jgi:hypothetical protein
MGMASDIRISAEPVDAQRCKFLVDRPVYQGVRRFGAPAEAAGSPLAEALFALPGVQEVIVSGNLVTVVKESPTAPRRRGPRGCPTTSCTSASTISSSSR